MRTKGFIFIALSLTSGVWAGTSGYLPGVGPVALRFERDVTYQATLPKPVVETTPHASPVVRKDFTVAIPVEPPTTPPPVVPLMQETPIAPPNVGVESLTAASADPNQPLISPMMETNGVVTPQMFLRFFTGPQDRDGSSAEAVIPVPSVFNPTRLPGPPSTATFNQSTP